MAIYIIPVYEFWSHPGIHMGDRLLLMTLVWTMMSPYTTEMNGLVLFPVEPPASMFSRPLHLTFEHLKEDESK
jgi:hypothetical protein